MQRFVSVVVLLASVGAAAWLLGWSGSEGPSAMPGASAPGPSTVDPRLHARTPASMHRHASPRTGRIHGTVVDQGGKAVADAQVSTTIEDVPVRASTTAEGAFLLEGLEPGVLHRVEVVAGADHGGATAHAHARRVRAEDLRLRVMRGAPLEGRVVDAAGEGVSAQLVARVGDEPGGPSPWSEWARADAEGRFRLHGVPPGGILVDVYGEEKPLLRGAFVPTPSEGPVVIRLGRAGGPAVAGRVVTEDGRPVAGALVRVRVVASRAQEGSLSARAEADERGAWRLEGLLEGRGTVSVEAEGYVPWKSAPGALELREGNEETVEAVLAPEAVLTGRVVGPAAEAIGGAYLSLMMDGSEFRYLRADDQGRFREGGLPARSGGLLAWAEGWYQPRGDAAGEAARRTHEALRIGPLEKGATTEVEVVLRRGVRLEGTVAGPDGRGVEGAIIELFGQAPVVWMSTGVLGPEISSGADGRFVVEGLPPRLEVTISARLGDLASPGVNVRPTPGERPEPLRLVLAPLASMSGTVLGQDGQPRGGVRLALAGQWSFRDGIYCGEIDGIYSDEIGAFRIDRLPAGRWRLRVAREPELEVDLGWGEHVVLPPMRVATAEHVAGTVEDPTGAPLAGVRVYFRGLAGPGAPFLGSADTDPGGRFRFEYLPPGRYELGTVGQDAPGVFVTAPATGVRLVHAPAAADVIEGEVVGPDGSPIPSAAAQLWTRTWDRPVVRTPRTTGTVTEGRLRLEVPAGFPPYDVSIHGPRAATGEPLDDLQVAKALDVRPGRPVRIRLENGFTARGRVLSEDGRGIPGISVQAPPPGGEGWLTILDGVPEPTDAEGRFTLRGRGPEPVEVRVAVAGTDWLPAEPFALLPGGPEVRVILRRGERLHGRVLGSQGEPLHGVNVDFEAPKDGGVSASSYTSRAGRFEMKGLAAGTAGRLRIRPSGDDPHFHLPATRDGVRPGGGEVVIRLDRGVSIEGEVEGPDGTAVAEVTLRARPAVEDGTWGLARTALGDKRFRLAPLAPGRYRLTATAPGGFTLPEPVEVEAPATGLRLRLAR